MTQLQKERLIDYVSSNYELLFGKVAYQIDVPSKDELWTQIAVELNAIGAIKDVPGWKRCYAALKSSTNRKIKNCTSEAPNGLNSLDYKIINPQSIPSNLLKTVNSTLIAPLSEQNQNRVTVTTDIKATGTYSTLLQRQHLVKLVGENYDALFGKLSNSSNGEFIKKKVWKLIADQVNTMGPKKDIPGWMRCFTSLKGSTKEKLTVIRQSKNRNSNVEDIELDTIQSEMLKMHPHDTHTKLLTNWASASTRPYQMRKY